MRKYLTRAELECLLLAAINLHSSTIKKSATKTGIKANTLRKWKTTPVHSSPEMADKLLQYFMERELDRLELTELVLSQKHKES